MVKDLPSQVSQLQGTDHQRRYNDLKAELKAYRLALDFNGNSAVMKLRSHVDEAMLAKCEDKDRLVAIQERISYSQRTGNSLDVRSALFNILAMPAEIEADKVVRRFEQKSRFPRTPGNLSKNTLSGVLALTVLDPAMPVGSRDILLGIAPPNGNCSSNV